MVEGGVGDFFRGGSWMEQAKAKGRASRKGCCGLAVPFGLLKAGYVASLRCNGRKGGMGKSGLGRLGCFVRPAFLLLLGRRAVQGGGVEITDTVDQLARELDVVSGLTVPSRLSVSERSGQA
ncbi:hypothetical protein BH09VER1_BH09VER1_46070 [soil metagenome]